MDQETENKIDYMHNLTIKAKDDLRKLCKQAGVHPDQCGAVAAAMTLSFIGDLLMKEQEKEVMSIVESMNFTLRYMLNGSDA